jgi:hypothetical protein
MSKYKFFLVLLLILLICTSEASTKKKKKKKKKSKLAKPQEFEKECLNKDACFLALSLTSRTEIFAEKYMYDKIRGDLKAIRVEYKMVSKIHDFRNKRHVTLRLRMQNNAYMHKMKYGNQPMFEELNEKYGPAHFGFEEEQYCIVSFETMANSLPLVLKYKELPGVLGVDEPNFIDDGNMIEIHYDEQKNLVYTFKKRWQDCQDKCVFQRLYKFMIVEGEVQKIEESGDPLGSVLENSKFQTHQMEIELEEEHDDSEDYYPG